VFGKAWVKLLLSGIDPRIPQRVHRLTGGLNAETSALDTHIATLVKATAPGLLGVCMGPRSCGHGRDDNVVAYRSPWSTLYGVEAPCLGNALEVMFAAIDEADPGPGGEIDDCS
jgi:hypothetical protein